LFAVELYNPERKNTPYILVLAGVDFF